MLNPAEVITLVLGLGAFIFINIIAREEMNRLPSPRVLIGSYLALFIAWFSTVFEGLLFPKFLNLLEHIGLAASALFALVWCLRAGGTLKEERK